MNRRLYLPVILVAAVMLSGCHHAVAQSESVPADQPCLEISLTGTQGGPPQVRGLAGSGTLVKYGSSESNCGEVVLQFDTGRNTTGRLSELGISVNKLDAVFFTHMHSDHSEGLVGLMQLRWHFMGGPLDIICSADVAAPNPPPGRTMSCASYLEHIGDALLASGEMIQRHIENRKRDPRGPAVLARLKAVDLPLPDRPGTVVWEKGDVQVTAIGSKHIPGHLSYRVDSPAGSVVIGGDAGNSKSEPPRDNSTSSTVELLAKDADVLVHSTMHPVFAPGAGSTFPPPVYYRQSTAYDLGSMAQRAGVKHLVLTHLIPALGTESHGPFRIPGGPLKPADFESAARDSGFDGHVHVGADLLTIKLP
jgi:ribonuclease Z